MGLVPCKACCQVPCSLKQYHVLPVQVFVHVDISNAEDDALWSSRASEGGSGAPLAFLIEKGPRAPRAWEITLKGTFECLCCNAHGLNLSDDGAGACRTPTFCLFGSCSRQLETAPVRFCFFSHFLTI